VPRPLQKTTRFELRLRPEEYETWKTAARLAGLSLTAFVSFAVEQLIGGEQKATETPSVPTQRPDPVAVLEQRTHTPCPRVPDRVPVAAVLGKRSYEPDWRGGKS
jgi:hypothetical protein